MSLDINDRRVLEHSRHTIYEAGIGNLIEQGIKYLEAERQIGKGQVPRHRDRFMTTAIACTVEIIRTERHSQGDIYRTVLYLDKEAKLPVRAENYDWPRQSGSPGDLIEQVSFTNLRWNVGLTDREFNK